MPRINNNEKNSAMEEYAAFFADITDSYPNIQQYLQHHFGINRGQIKVLEDPSGESVYLVFRQDTFWLFEIEEFTNYYFGQDLYEHLSDRLSSAYDRISKKYF
ncbi:hypothetical protein XaC1_336 [Xanthomonas phage XaC1]|nr:hypothetical protein XaC1_336 [Xanthomonas phage XaC1]